MSPAAAAESIANAVQELQKHSQQQQIVAKHVKSIEAKLSALEGSMLTAGNLPHIPPLDDQSNLHSMAI